jgi:hypothetical protein
MRYINDNICSMVVGIIWRGILVREAREGGIQVVLLLRELFSCSSFESSPSGSRSGESFFNNLKKSVFAGLTGPTFF